MEDERERRRNLKNKTQSSNDSQRQLHSIKLFYGGDFVHIPVCSYTSQLYKVYYNIDLESITISQLKVRVGDVLGEYDSLYYKVESGIKLVNNESLPKIAEYSKSCKNMAMLFVYHVIPPGFDSDRDDEDDRNGHSYSDDEFVEIRKKSRLEKKKLDELQEKHYSDEDTESDSSLNSGSLNYKSSEDESDSEICYAAPPTSDKEKSVILLFNEMTPASDIKWRVGLIFADKKQLKNAVRSSSMETGRPYHYLVDDKRRVQVGCAKSCPFKMWVTHIKENQGWQIKTLRDEHNCVWTYNNMLVTVKWLADKYGDRIRKNPNWKLREMQEEFKRELKVDVGEWKCSKVDVPKMKRILDEAIKDSVGFRVLWDGRDKYVVKGNGTSCEVSLNNRTCSCRVWELTGVPCCHGVTAIQHSRQNPVDFVAHWFTKETYMKCYSNCIEVIRGEEFWDDVIGDNVLPPLIVKKLRGRPKNCRRREGWEGGRGTVCSGKYKRMSYAGRVMHCGYCRKEGHKINACPDKPHDYVPPKRGEKKGRPKKVMTEQFDETQVELQLQQKEDATGEDLMMVELLNQMENAADTQNELVPILYDDVEMQPTARMLFVPTPGTTTPPNVFVEKKKKWRKACGANQLSNSQTGIRSTSGRLLKKVQKFTPPRTIRN
ncbi:uncharacterized protein LOC108217625 [Daucus carota subsp. sativus]|uniref:uncharacterized protein LOC108217625 n=1 Tax=Daucus carota subsp. sativus TaxID=79200 RepID=UPI0007EF8638|nr:PREDICTED: uncharacterized protein LOC108217625 [Daucus carota subsp. sativus]